MDRDDTKCLTSVDVHKIEDLIFTANCHNVIITELSDTSPIFKGYINFDDDDYWYFLKDQPDDCVDYFNGPDCALCGRLAFPDEDIIEYNKQHFTLVYKKTADQKTEGDLEGFLRCVYCFKYFHRYKCIFELSDNSYYQVKACKSWSCPGCVPIFTPQCEKGKIPKPSIKCFVNFKTIVLLFKALYHLGNFLTFDNSLYIFIELTLFLYGIFVFLIFSIDVG